DLAKFVAVLCGLDLFVSVDALIQAGHERAETNAETHGQLPIPVVLPMIVLPSGLVPPSSLPAPWLSAPPPSAMPGKPPRIPDSVLQTPPSLSLPAISALVTSPLTSG